MQCCCTLQLPQITIGRITSTLTARLSASARCFSPDRFASPDQQARGNTDDRV